MYKANYLQRTTYKSVTDTGEKNGLKLGGVKCYQTSCPSSS